MKKILTSNGKPLFKDGKLLASSRGSGSATVTTKAGWKGTAVPTSGYLENVYFNINLTPEEIMNLIDKLIIEFGVDENFINIPIFVYMQDISYGCFMSYNKETQSCGIGIEGEIDDINWLFVYSKNDELNSNYLEHIGFIGWNPDLIDNNGVLNLNKELIDFTEDFYDVIVVFLNLISSLISSIPFEVIPGETITLTGDYDGSPIITDIVGGWQGTPIPTSGYIEKVYVNTNLSVDEVKKIILGVGEAYVFSGTEYEGDGTFLKYPYLICSTTGFQITGAGEGGGLNYYFASVPGTLVGWNPNFNGEIIVNHEIYPAYLDADTVWGTKNDKLSSLFSITPFTYKENNTIDMKPYINEKKLPLKINVNGPKVVSGGSNASGTPIPSSGYIENIYVNVNTEPEELANKLDELLAGIGADPAEGFEFPLFFNEDETVFGGLVSGGNAYGLSILIGETLIIPYVYTRDSTKEAQIMAEIGFIGWNPTLTDGVIPVNTAIVDISILLEDYFAMWEMAVNEITPFISSTPFVGSGDKETVELVGEYDGSSITIDPYSHNWNGKEVMKTGFIENIYLNTYLSTGNVSEKLTNLSYDYYLDSRKYFIFYNSDNYYLSCNTFGGAYEGIYTITFVTENGSEILFTSSEISEVDFVGWNPSFDGCLEINKDNNITLLDLKNNSSISNNDFKDLFSISAFKNEKNNYINLRPYLKNNKLPLDIYLSNNNSIMMTKKYDFKKGSTNGKETFVCELSKFECDLLTDFALNQNMINGFSACINMSINKSNENLFFGFSLNNLSGYGSSMNRLDSLYFTNGYVFINFAISLTSYTLYLNSIAGCAFNGQGYIFDNSVTIDSVESISLVIPYV